VSRQGSLTRANSAGMLVIAVRDRCRLISRPDTLWRCHGRLHRRFVTPNGDQSTMTSAISGTYAKRVAGRTRVMLLASAWRRAGSTATTPHRRRPSLAPPLRQDQNQHGASDGPNHRERSSRATRSPRDSALERRRGDAPNVLTIKDDSSH
jgi:hypothetical protein